MTKDDLLKRIADTERLANAYMLDNMDAGEILDWLLEALLKVAQADMVSTERITNDGAVIASLKKALESVNAENGRLRNLEDTLLSVLDEKDTEIDRLRDHLAERESTIKAWVDQYNREGTFQAQRRIIRQLQEEVALLRQYPDVVINCDLAKEAMYAHDQDIAVYENAVDCLEAERRTLKRALWRIAYLTPIGPAASEAFGAWYRATSCA